MNNFVIWLTGTTLKDRLTNLAAGMAFAGTVTALVIEVDWSRGEQVAALMTGLSIALNAWATGKLPDLSGSDRQKSNG